MGDEMLAIDSIVVGERRRENYGDIDGLAASITRFGVLHPIVIDANNNLVSGGRRLKALVKLKCKDAPVRRLGDLSPVELREIELEENLRRKDLTASEKSKLMVEYVEAAETAAKEEAKRKPKNNGKVSGEVPPKRSKRGRKEGRPPQPGSERDVEERTGIDRRTARDAKKHVDAFTRYPFLEQPHWSQSTALQAFKALEELPEKDREPAAAMVAEPATPPDYAIRMLRTLGMMTAKHRAEVFSDFVSGDERRKSDAICCAAKTPPMPDPRTLENAEILRRITKAEKLGAADEYAVARKAIEALQAKLNKEYERVAKTLAGRNGAA